MGELKSRVSWWWFGVRVALSRRICSIDSVTMRDAIAGREALVRELKMLTGKDYVTEPVNGSNRYRAVPWEDRDKSQWHTGTVVAKS